MTHQVRLPATLALTAIAALTGSLSAQNARVVAANSSNGRILEITFQPPGSSVLNTDANLRVGLQSLAFRADGAAGVHIVAADHQAGKVIFYPGGSGAGVTMLDRATAGHPTYPDGLSLGAHGDLFGTSSANGTTTDKDPRVWVALRDPTCTTGCLPGGYRRVGTIDDHVTINVLIGGVPTNLPLELLEESRVVVSSTGALAAGDLLVLASDPPVLLRYPAAAVDAFLDQLALGQTPAELVPEVFVYPPNASVAADRRFPVGSTPTGLDLTAGGRLLIGSGDGRILVFRPDGTRLSDGGGFVDFATGLGQGKFKLATGLQNGAERAFVADRNGGEVLRFLVGTDGRGTLDGVVADAEFPVGIATTTSNVVPTPPGLGITIRPTDLMETTIENVVVGGATGVNVYTFTDPRESEVSVPPGQPLHRALRLSEIRADLPPDAEIPAYVRAFRKGDPLTGPPTFLLILADTSVEVAGLLAHVVDESLVLGWEPDCDAPLTSDQPRLFWVPSPDEPQSLESPVFADVTNGCGTSRGLTRSWSLFLASARDTRAVSVIVGAKLTALDTVLAQATCVDRRLSRSLDRSLDTVIRQYQRGKIAQAISELEWFAAQAAATPTAYSSCDVNEGGELRARAESLIYFLRKL